ncbi:hypothetical protein GCM10027578_00360 [Spirosoma luteolum]
MLRFTQAWQSLTRTAVCLLVSVACSYGQQPADPAPVVKFGKLTPDAFQTPAADSTAEAIVLYKSGITSFKVNSSQLWLTTSYHVRTLIRKKSGYPLATLEMMTRRGSAGQHEYVSGFEGQTYNLVNGVVQVDKMPKTSHFSEHSSDKYWLEKYSLPNVREGSIIEYRYDMVTPFSVSHTPRPWSFQSDVPVRWSEYQITIPDYFNYNMIHNGYLALAVNQHDRALVALLPGQDQAPATAYRFAVKDAPAFRNEAYITTPDDYLSRIELELASYQLPNSIREDLSNTWESIDKTLLADSEFGGQIRRGGFLKETAKTLLTQHRDTLARISAAYDLVRQRVKWNEENAFWSANVRKAFDDRKGSAGDINLLLVALLREMDMDANPVILSTRANGRINPAFALLRKFNYVVAHVSVGGKELLLDATDTWLTPGMVARQALNGVGRLVHPTQARFIPIETAARSVETLSGVLTINEEGDVSGTMALIESGYDGLDTRRSVAAHGKTGYVEELQKDHKSWQIESATVSNHPDMATGTTTSLTVTVPNACGQAGDRLYLRPLLTEGYTENPFKEENRLYPVDFGVPITESFSAVYTLPAGYAAEELPKTAVISLPDKGGRFTYEVKAEGNQLRVLSRLTLNEATYSAEAYGALRELFAMMVAKQAEQVVLKRQPGK